MNKGTAAGSPYKKITALLKDGRKCSGIYKNATEMKRCLGFLGIDKIESVENLPTIVTEDIAKKYPNVCLIHCHNEVNRDDLDRLIFSKNYGYKLDYKHYILKDVNKVQREGNFFISGGISVLSDLRPEEYKIDNYIGKPLYYEISYFGITGEKTKATASSEKVFTYKGQTITASSREEAVRVFSGNMSLKEKIDNAKNFNKNILEEIKEMVFDLNNGQRGDWKFKLASHDKDYYTIEGEKEQSEVGSIDSAVWEWYIDDKKVNSWYYENSIGLKDTSTFRNIDTVQKFMDVIRDDKHL